MPGADENVVPLRPPAAPAGAATPPAPEQQKSFEQVLAFCERVEEGLQHVAATLVQMDARLRRLELARAKDEKKKLQATAIYNGHGERVR